MGICRISLKPVGAGSKYPDYKDSEFRSLFGSLRVNPVLSFSRKDFFRESSVKSVGMSISGVQEKLSVKIDKNNQLQMTKTGGEYILKPSPEAFAHAAENEHCAMLTSRLLKIPTALCGLVSFSDGEPVYITRRFDRSPDGKIHQEDLAQGFNIKSDEKYSRSYESAGKLISRMVNGKAAAVMDFFRRVVHAYLIGNDDMHLKNISVQKNISAGSHYDRLTPNYDCLFTQAFKRMATVGFLALDLLEDEQDGIYSAAYMRYGFYTGTDFLDFGQKIGLRQKPVTKYLEFVGEKEKDLLELVNLSFMTTPMKEATCQLIKERVKALGFF